jgi:hypothetical protein
VKDSLLRPRAHETPENTKKDDTESKDLPVNGQIDGQAKADRAISAEKSAAG